ncbi:DUF4184 family protein [Dactylosporangium aurantiacum]|uniref:DUF4184 family protein n=1 Tax=Dactylosporangium aurantiacum TaxID=35754 RepID=A0A9Q9MIC3_9ACTN|nr:DUF4184 family protein [Dactylosporangium aurantiacum]MDG6106677.1 DUF4184 family protein [Dactylosporangium aurantiacum]UWZ50832.1 DUF4184 family protein [Dactylosporangium aurantiacum]
MPLTFPTHPAAVLPLKLWRPRWFDEIALVIGAMAPDLAYTLDGSGLPVWPLSHQVAGLVLWCLPVTLAAAWLVRRVTPVVAAHLPAGGPFALTDYGALGRHRPHPVVVLTSALLGAASHLALDRLETVVPPSVYVMHVLGFAGLLGTVTVIGRRRLLRAWHGDPPVVRRRPALFWTVGAVVTGGAAAVVPFLPGAALGHTTGTRLLCAVAAGLLAAPAAVSVAGLRARLRRFSRATADGGGQ